MSESKEVHIFAVLIAQAGKEDQLRGVLNALVAPTRQEPGNIHYMLHEDPKAPGSFYFFEAYKDQAAADEHMKSPYLATALSKARDILKTAPSIVPTKLIAGA